MFNQNDISFRKLELNDLPLLHKWLNNPHVREWYDKDKSSTLENVTKRYMEKINGDKPTQAFIANYKNKPVGYIQTYKLNDYPDYVKYINPIKNTAGVDLFIGEPDSVGKGLGKLILNKFLAKVVFIQENIESCVVGPEPKNKRAIKAYEKAGFHYLKTIHISDEPEPEYLMVINKNVAVV